MRNRAQSVGRRHGEIASYPMSAQLAETVIASEAKQSIAPRMEGMDCFVACAPLRKRFAFVAGNDDPTTYPNRFLRHSISLALTSSGFSCWVQCPLPRTRYFSRSGTIFSMPSAADGGSTASFSAMIINDGTRTV